MQHQQQQVGGGVAPDMVISDEDQKLGDLGIAEAASPISSRPPAPAAIGNTNFEELIQATAEAGSSSGNRWPRQETLALLQIRSEMDAAFRDATLKGPLWEQVSRRLAELGYKRNAKKCKEKFENVHKYYKRTKEGRGGRQDGKSYKFFTQLEALNHSIATGVQVLPIIANPTSIPAAAAVVSMPPPPVPQPATATTAAVSLPPPDHTTTTAAATGTGAREGSAVHLFGNFGVSFSSNSSSSSDGEDDEEMEMESAENRNQRKRKRSRGGDDHGDEKMMDFFEGLLKQVMQKQETMQQKFLEAIEKREQDRMIREEAWKRQDMARIAREHDLLAQERAISASRDAAIIAFLEKITGQSIHLPTAVPQNPPPPTPTVLAPTVATVPPHQPPPSEPKEQHHQQPTFHQQKPERQNQTHSMEIIVAHQVKITSDKVAVVPEHQIPQHDLTGGSSLEMMSSSRWPKAEVLALIHLRSGMESKYQESCPKGPLWEEISAGMQRMGYNRSAKRCKEKWENINKYFKKVKESNKKRPEDAKTCPYFHELDALYQKKILGNTSGNIVDVAGSSGGLSEPERKYQHQHQHQQDVATQTLPGNVSVDKDGRRTEVQTTGGVAFPATPFGDHRKSNVGGEKQPEDMMKKQLEKRNGHMRDNCSNSIDCSNSEDEFDSYEEIDENEEYDDKTEDEMKMVYKIQLQSPTVRSSNGGGTPPSSFVAMVQ